MFILLLIDCFSDDEDVDYHCMACLTNLGDLVVYAVPSLRPHMKTNAIKKDNVWYANSFPFSPRSKLSFNPSNNIFIRGHLVAFAQ